MSDDGLHHPTIADLNRVARDNADLRDEMATLKANYADRQEAWARETAQLRLTAGLSLDEVTDEVYEDSHKVLDALKDRCWEQGRLEGLREARNHIEKYVTEQVTSA